MCDWFYDVFLAIAQVLSHTSGGPRSFWEFMGLLLTIVGFLIALWLIWVLLQWVVEKLRRK
jgi:type IV secretory pathway TrbD component